MPNTRPEIAIRGDAGARAVEQLARCAEAGDAVRAALCADAHVGHSQPIGGVIAYPEHLSVSAAGHDIGCGVKGTLTDAKVQDADVGRVMDTIVRRISFGVGRATKQRSDHPAIKVTHRLRPVGVAMAGAHVFDPYKD